MQPSSRSKAKLAFQQPPRSASRAAQNRANGKPTPAPSLPITTTAAIETLHPAKPRYTERLDRLQFMAGQVGLYSDHINPRQRPDSKRPQALKKMWNRHGRRVACAKRCGCRTAARRDLPESNLCSGKSGCIAMISTRTNVQTRAAPKRRGVGLHARSGVDAALRPPEYTERPARLQFMAGMVGLYNKHTNTHQRPDSKRSQALKSRVACAKRSGRGHCRLRLFSRRCGRIWSI